MRGIRELLNITGAREKTRAVVCSAIRSRRVIEFLYHGGYRTVEPFCLGLVMSGDADNESLLCYQTGGLSDLREVVGWKLYRASEIEDIEVLSESFVGDRPGYDPDAVEMVKVYCCVTPPAGGEAPVAAGEMAKLPRYEVGDSTLAEIPKVKSRLLTHNELMRIFHLNHPTSIPGFFSGPSPNPLPERTEWELRHFMQMFGHLYLMEQTA